MDNNELDKLLHQLHEEITKTHTVDEKGTLLLRDLEADIRTLLESTQEHPVSLHPSIVQRLEVALNQFELSHPRLTTLISNLLDSLSAAGL